MAGQVPVHKNKNLYIIFSVTLMAVMGVASISPAFPAMARYFDIDKEQIGWLITAFTLPGVFLTPFFGVIADRFGRKIVLVPALFLFAVAGFACSQVNDFSVLVILRFVQGIGGASLGSLNATLIGDIFNKEERPAAMGYNASVLSIATASYPFFGGALAMLGWNYPFYFPLLAIPVGLLVMFGLKNPDPRGGEAFRDYIRAALNSVLNKQVYALFALNVLTFIILYGSYLTFFPLIMDAKFGSNSFIIGTVMSVSSITTALTSALNGRLNKIYSPAILLRFAYGFYILSLVIVPFVSNQWLMFLPAVFFGIAQGINMPNIQTMLLSLAPMKHRGAFMSVNGMVLRLGQTLGPVFAGAFSAIGGAEYAFYGGAFVAFIMILIVVFGLSGEFEEKH